ncbi:hypothetical protein AB0465_02525 [Streptomyces griseoviridis]|uniref:hypothetical protein n=1 Tax=Streptomyces griseoviridis TaxID=45398 RepID=UPI00344FD69D
MAIDGEEGVGIVQLERGGGDLFDARDGECVKADQGSHDAEFSGQSLVCEASPQLLLVLVVRLEVRSESLAGELCIERSGQFSLREPSDEGVDGLPSGGVLREPQIQVLLVQVQEDELVLVEPVQQEDCSSDVVTVGLRGAKSVTSALRSAACVLDDVPFREGADDPGLVWGQGFEGGSRPELEPGKGLVAFGEGSGHDEVVPDVAGDRSRSP